ncbi:peroxisome assembly protein 12 isoform X2 [Diorhabda sublineata]|uniref:peroxisome assembly protein 12 isoform X2 n=1 Tax=Diorhabda sublineata TaxID=1163346 RepID=UPI0024E098D5|nr:peroxisome assembly protein 12 isoform X2 [Diorhabda sublineata]
MAENAANFTFTLQNRPSILEVIAQQSLNNTLHPAFQKIALFLSTNVPYKFGWLNKYFEETFAILNGLLQYHYLTYYVGIPYFKRKLEEKITVIRIEQAEGALKSDFESIMKKFLLFTHSTFEFVWGVFLIHNYIKYMAQSTEYQTPIYQLIDTKLVYDRNVEDQSGFWTSLFKGSLSLSQINFGIIRNGISTTLEVGAFFLQFLQVWNSQKSNYNMTDLPNVPAPMLDNKAKKYEGKCPLCLKSWTIPTVLQVSGYIFCFRCILRHLNEHQKCPVTSLPAKPLDIVRLYIN